MCRRMFPIVALRLSGLEPRELYELELEVVPADCRRYKFVNSTWVPVGAADSGILNPPYPHGDSPNTGEYWMSCRQIQFNKVKLTNSRDSVDGNVSSVSFQRFVTSIGGLLLSGATCTVSLRGFFTFIIPFSPSYSTRGRDSIDGNVSSVSFQPFVSFECLLLSRAT